MSYDELKINLTQTQNITTFYRKKRLEDLTHWFHCDPTSVNQHRL